MLTLTFDHDYQLKISIPGEEIDGGQAPVDYHSQYKDNNQRYLKTPSVKIRWLRQAYNLHYSQLDLELDDKRLEIFTF